MKRRTWFALGLFLFPALPAGAQVERAVMGVTNSEMS
jgi:hypothetical protein